MIDFPSNVASDYTAMYGVEKVTITTKDGPITNVDAKGMAARRSDAQMIGAVAVSPKIRVWNVFMATLPDGTELVVGNRLTDGDNNVWLFKTADLLTASSRYRCVATLQD